MNLKRQLTLAFLISLLCIIGFGLNAILISQRKIARFDEIIIQWVQGLESPIMTSIMKFFTFIGSSFPVMLLALFVMWILYKWLHHRRELILFLWVVVGSALLNLALKLSFHRARPDLHRIVEANGFSFPSGHSMAAFSLYGVLAFLLWRHIPTAVGRGILIVLSAAITVTIGFSRIYLGVHYPSDVLGGFLASGFWLAFSVWIFQRNEEKRAFAQSGAQQG